MRPLTEHVILITGATDGLGKAVALHLARAGATLLLHGRDEARGQQTLDEIRAQTGNTRLQWYRADFSALAQVRALAERLARERERIDVLLNNAGIGTTLPGGGTRQESEDGYELRFAVNYLAPFLLTRLLLPTLRRLLPALSTLPRLDRLPLTLGTSCWSAGTMEFRRIARANWRS